MSRETLEIVTSRKIEEVQLQLALPCAPLIAGLKLANLLNITPSHFGTVRSGAGGMRKFRKAAGRRIKKMKSRDFLKRNPCFS